MSTAGLIALTFLGLVVAPCAIGLRIRASLHHGLPARSEIKP